MSDFFKVFESVAVECSAYKICPQEKARQKFFSEVMYDLRVIQEEYDPTIFGRKPTRVVNKSIRRFQHSSNHTINVEIGIRKNEIVTADSLLSLGQEDNYVYYDIDPTSVVTDSFSTFVSKQGDRMLHRLAIFMAD